jgi:hypothetical protein
MRFKTTQTFLPGFAPRTDAAPLARLDDPKTLLEIELLVEQVTAYIDTVRRGRQPGAPTDMADVIACRKDIKALLPVDRLPIPGDDYLDKLIAELAWFHDFALTPAVRALADIETLQE